MKPVWQKNENSCREYTISNAAQVFELPNDATDHGQRKSEQYAFPRNQPGNGRVGMGGSLPFGMAGCLDNMAAHVSLTRIIACGLVVPLSIDFALWFDMATRDRAETPRDQLA